MSNRKYISTILTTTVVCCAALGLVLMVGCKKETPAPPPGANEAPAATAVSAEAEKVQEELTEKAVEYANVRCPIMGTKMKLTNVPKNLRRVHKGQNVAFCCAECPAKWDKLSDAEKVTKLAAVSGK